MKAVFQMDFGLFLHQTTIVPPYRALGPYEMREMAAEALKEPDDA